ncbi:hypothetical protein Q0N28_14595, partial [Staphylococcus aureus]|nr:hypothetical protein [Staphylococcus aureus]
QRSCQLSITLSHNPRDLVATDKAGKEGALLALELRRKRASAHLCPPGEASSGASFRPLLLQASAVS